MSNFSTCKECNERYVGCHSSCERYIEAKKAHDEKRKHIVSALAKERDVCIYEKARIRKIASRKREHK